MTIIITKDFHFEAAQSLASFPEGHKCRHIHGHSFKVSISIKGPVNPQTGLLRDHAEISQAMRPILKKIDHAYLNDIPGLENPTIENIAAWLWHQLKPHLPELYEITLHETPHARCTFRGEF
ncbi:MAG: 6-carboxytetrahydropterin synthase QueD [Methylacidiphilales bacterium]|nr:6-carboxytetrahydropterin synthase QueD [Candidatus Methylacidiphilales bacterium]MDW8349031.1 6-carboxytetrahydropterin synthase QueD [Verrucomicrobiae bacterium]